MQWYKTYLKKQKFKHVLRMSSLGIWQNFYSFQFVRVRVLSIDAQKTSTDEAKLIIVVTCKILRQNDWEDNVTSSCLQSVLKL